MKKIYFIFILLFINFNPLYAHQPFGILINEGKSHFVNLRDASVSHAFYGEFNSKDEEVLINAQILSGDHLEFSLLIPDKLPENELPEKNLPYIVLSDSSKNQNVYHAEERVKFHEPFSNMDLIRIISYKNKELIDTNYSLKVVSKNKTRFVVSIGYKENFSTTYADGEVTKLGKEGLDKWYFIEQKSNENYLLTRILIPIFFGFLFFILIVFIKRLRYE